MSQIKYFITFVYLAFISVAYVHALPDSNTIEFDNCTISLPGTTYTTRAQCGWLEVAEDHNKPDGEKISLHIALATAVSRTPEPDPLFLFAGGPGQAASEAYVMLQPILEKIRKNRDIVLIDQRGTGESNPLTCPIDEADSLQTSLDLELVRQHTQHCLDEIKGDPRLYTTTIAMHDYDLVRQAIGYDQINLLGISYGTRTAQVYLRHYENHVRTMILDSVVPMELHLGEDHAKMLDRAVSEIFAACKRDTYCHDLFADGIDGLDQLFKDLRQQPREISFIHPATGKQDSLTVTADILAFAIRFLSYSSESQAVLPLLIHEAVTTGKLERLAAHSLIIMDGINEQISQGMEMSVICTEDYPFMVQEENNADTILGNTLMDVLHTQCGIWPKGKIDVDFHEPITSVVPVLLLTGTLDPVTPPVYAKQTAENFQNSHVLTAVGLGHAVISNYCLQQIATEFIELGTMDAIDTECVAKIKSAPFFTTLLGPDP